MIKVPIDGTHDFKKTHDFTQNDRGESFDRMKCSHCGLIGRRHFRKDLFVMVSDTYSSQRIQDCERDNFIDIYRGKQIQTICNIHGGKDYNNIPIYSIHNIITPPIGIINGENGVWVQGVTKPVQILPDEFIFYPLKSRFKPRQRTIPVKVIRTRTLPPVIQRKRTK
jgi:hypothetical protein